MQPKRRSPRLMIFLALAVIAVSGLAIMLKDVPPSQRIIEKPLDAKAFLEQPAP